MAGMVHAKKVKGKKLWYVLGAVGDVKWTREFPECRSRNELYECLSTDLGLPHLSSKDVVFILANKSWVDGRWIDDFAVRLQYLRKDAGLTQIQLATAAGLSSQAIAALEQGTRSPTWDTVLRLSEALGVATEDFRLDKSSLVGKDKSLSN